MQAVILAAGIGKRLAKETNGKPKSLLKIGSRSIIQRQIECCLKAGINDFVIVIGFCQELMRKHINMILKEDQVTYVINDIYDKTNTLYSLYLAHQYFRGDILYFNADVVFEEHLLKKLLDYPGSSVLVEKRNDCGAEEVKVILDQKGMLKMIGKDLPGNQSVGEFMGIACFRKETAIELVKCLQVGIELEQHNNFFEYALNRFCADLEVRAIFTGTAKCLEIDFPEDLRRAWELFDQ